MFGIKYIHLFYQLIKELKNKIMKTLEFKTEGTNNFGFFTDNRKVKTDALSGDIEQVFLDCLKSLPKRLLKTWESLEFQFDDEKVTVCKHWLEETDWDFHQSHEVEVLS